MMSMRLSLSHVMTCEVCQQTIDDDRARVTETCAVLFGAVAYAVCPCCHQEVQDYKDLEYQGRCDEWTRRAREEER